LLKNIQAANMKKKDSKYYDSVIRKIEELRKNNNGNWMDLLRIAYKYSPNEAADVMSKIYREDKKISSLAKKLMKK